MVTGTLPFAASDPMELVHCHIARTADTAMREDQSVPRAVSAIIMKLLAKTAEERYQTAVGVASDLRRCLAEWETQHRIDRVPSGRAGHTRPVADPRETVRARIRNQRLARCVRPCGGRRQSRSSFWSPATPVSANPPSSMNCTNLWFPRAAFLHRANSISTSATSRIRHFGSGVSEPDPTTSGKERSRVGALAGRPARSIGSRTARLIVDLVPEIETRNRGPATRS